MNATALVLLAHLALSCVVIGRIMLREHREPASRIAWVAVVIAVPIVGIVAYFLFGEVNIGRSRALRMRHVIDHLSLLEDNSADGEPDLQAQIPPKYEPLFRVGHSISGFNAIGGNRGRLLKDSNATIDAIVADIDAAEQHVHLLFYIWLPDNNGCKVADALKRAAQRGVACRAMVDNLGSRLMISSEKWQEMEQAGVRLAIALPIGNPMIRPFIGRIDLRNHRKIVVIDGRITYCGSQNCADPEFRIKPRYAPWVDAVMRLEGPIARQNQVLFASDWMAYVDEDLDDLLRSPTETHKPGFAAQVIGTGPTVRYSAMPEVFSTLIYSARQELIITTPYYVPDETLQRALCSAAHRGVETTIVFPERNDSWIVAGASRSHYSELLEAGVNIYEYVGGLLHTKSLTIDGEVTLIGSANMDRRSFDLNYENNILLHDPGMTSSMRERQFLYLESSKKVMRETVESWTLSHRLWNNTLAMLGPIL